MSLFRVKQRQWEASARRRGPEEFSLVVRNILWVSGLAKKQTFSALHNKIGS